MRIWSTYRLFTLGLKEFDADVYEPTGMAEPYYNDGYWLSHTLRLRKEGVDWHRTKKAAISFANKATKQRIKKLRRLINKLENIHWQ